MGYDPKLLDRAVLGRSGVNLLSLCDLILDKKLSPVEDLVGVGGSVTKIDIAGYPIQVECSVEVVETMLNA